MPRERSYFHFHYEWMDIIGALPQELQLNALRAVIDCAFSGVEPACDSLTTIVLKTIIPKVKFDRQKWLNGCKGGAPIGNKNHPKKQPKVNQDSTKIQPRFNQDSTKSQPKVNQDSTKIDDDFSPANPHEQKDLQSYSQNNQKTTEKTTPATNLKENEKDKEKEKSFLPPKPPIIPIEKKEEKEKENVTVIRAREDSQKISSTAKKPRTFAPKKFYAENVSLTEKEYDDLVSRYGLTDAKGMIELLDAYKLSSGKKYASDAGAIRVWVASRYLQDKQRNNNSQAIKPSYPARLQSPDLDEATRDLVRRGLVEVSPEEMNRLFPESESKSPEPPKPVRVARRSPFDDDDDGVPF